MKENRAARDVSEDKREKGERDERIGLPAERVSPGEESRVLGIWCNGKERR